MAALGFRISPVNLIGDFGYFESWSGGTSVAPDGWSLSGASAAVARESSVYKYGQYSAKITRASGDAVLSYLLGSPTAYQGRTLSLGFWVYCSTGSVARITVDDGVGSSSSSYHTGGGGWEWITVEHQVDTTTVQITIKCEVKNTNTFAYFDGGLLTDGELLWTEFRGDNVYIKDSDFDVSVKYQIGSFTIPRRDGMQIQNILRRESRIRLKIQIQHTSLSSARAIFDTITKAVSDGEKDLIFADDRVAKVRLISVSAMTFLAEAEVWVFDLQFSAPSGTSQYIATLRDDTQVDASPKSFSLEVSGSIKTYPRMYFLPPTGVPLVSCTFENLTTGERFSFVDTVLAGKTLLVDCEDFKTENDAVDGLSYFTGDFMALVPGTNYMKFTGTTGITIYVDRVDRFLA